MREIDCPWCGSYNTQLYKEKNYSVTKGLLGGLIIGGSFGFLTGFHNNRDEYVCNDCKQIFKE